MTFILFQREPTVVKILQIHNSLHQHSGFILASPEARLVADVVALQRVFCG
jgi:hypothetical protein